MSNVSRKLSRKILFQKLYADCFYKNNHDDFKVSFFDGKFDFEIDEKYIEEMHRLVVEKQWVLAQIVKRYAPKFDIAKMHLSYVIPIYIGATEMIYFSGEIPAKVSINEWIEIAKTYGDDSAKKIVNAVLNKIYENYEALKKEVDTITPDTSFSLFV